MHQKREKRENLSVNLKKLGEFFFLFISSESFTWGVRPLLTLLKRDSNTAFFMCILWNFYEQLLWGTSVTAASISLKDMNHATPCAGGF